jgi:hypothetical protein
MANRIPGYAVHGVATEFRDLATYNTFVTDCAEGAPHYQKIGEHHAGPADARFTGSVAFPPHALIYQTIPTNREVVGVVGAAAGAAAIDEMIAPAVGENFIAGSTDKRAPFSPGDMIQLTILQGIEHTAEIREHDGGDRWKVSAEIAGKGFVFIVFEHQILAQQSYIVTGFTQVGIAGEGTVAFVPHVTIVRAFDSKQARNEALLERPGLKIVSVSDKSPEWEPAFFDAGGEVIWAATSA